MLASLAILFNAFFEICLLRRGPQDLPASRFLFFLTLSLYCLMGVTVGLLQGHPGPAAVATVVNATFMAGFVLVLLQLSGRAERLVQTMTALVGTSLALTLIALPLGIWAAQSDPEHGALPTSLWLGVFLWDLVITAHILRHALSTRFVVGFLLATLYTLLLFQMMSVALPFEFEQ